MTVERFDLDRVLLDRDLQNIAQRARQRRGEAIIDGVLVAALGVSLTFTGAFALLCWLVVHGRL